MDLLSTLTSMMESVRVRDIKRRLFGVAGDLYLVSGKPVITYKAYVDGSVLKSNDRDYMPTMSDLRIADDFVEALVTELMEVAAAKKITRIEVSYNTRSGYKKLVIK